MAGRGRDAGRLAAELVVIVAGVLIALGAEAWWDGRREAQAEREYLELLDGELAALEIELDDRLAEEDELRTRYRTEMTVVSTGPSDTVAAIGLNTTAPEFRTGALSQIDRIQGPVLRDAPELRAALADLHASVEAARDLLAAFFRDMMANTREATTSLTTLQLSVGGQPTAGDVRSSPGLLAALTFHGILMENRIRLLQNLRTEVREARASLRDVAGVGSADPDPGGEEDGTSGSGESAAGGSDPG